MPVKGVFSYISCVLTPLTAKFGLLLSGELATKSTRENTQHSTETEDREYRPLEQVRDNYPKFVLTRNDMIQRRNGIVHRNIPEMMSQGLGFEA